MMSCEKSYLNRIHRTAFLLDTEYIDIIRGNNQNAYTRKRKILLPHIFMQMLATTGKSQKNEISDFIEQVDENIEILSEYEDSIRTYSDKLLKNLRVYKKISNINKYSIKNYSIEYFEDIVKNEESINKFSDKFYNDILNKKEDYSKEIEILNNRLEKLKKGVKDYDEVLINLKSKIEMDINKKYDSDIKVEILA